MLQIYKKSFRMEKKIKRERNSSTKTEIISLLNEKKTALTHKDFQDYFEKSIDRVTIYRALDRLVEEGKLHRIANLEGEFNMRCVIHVRMKHIFTIMIIYILVVESVKKQSV